MKKSKLLKALLVFGMSMVTATAIVGFTACGDEHDHVDENKDGKCDICETDMTPQGDDSGTNLKVPVEKVELNKSDITLEIGGEETLTATVTPDTATVKAVNWSVEPAGVVTVVGGKVTAVAAGTATITATADGKSATCSVTVNEPAPQPEVTKEEWAEILESVHNFTLTESTESKTSVQKVDGDKIGLADGSILVKDGETYYEYHVDGETEKWVKDEIPAQKYEATASVFSGFVSGIKDLYDEFEINDDGVYVAKHAIDMAGIGELQNLEVTFNHGKLTGITFETHSKISGDVTIDVPNQGTPAEQADEPTEGGGETTETPDPTEGGETTETPDPTENLLITSYEVSDVGTTVVDLPKIDGEQVKVDVEKVELNKGELTLDIDGEETLTATVTPDNADDKTVSWTSSDPSVATVDNSGKVTAVAAGTATITATADGQSATCSVTVNDPNGEHVKVDVEKVELNKNTLTLKVGGEETLTATVTPDNADDKTVSWTSSDTSVATVDNSGKVTAVAAGTATITATADGQSATCSVTVNDGNETGIALTFSNITRYGGANNDENVEMTVKYDISVQEALTMGADNQFDAAYINGELNADTGWADEGTPGGTTHQAHLWLRGFTAQYDTEYVITLKKGDTVVATGTLLIETPKSMTVSSESESLKGTALTLDPEDVVMLEASITGKFPAGAAYKWEITEGAEYIELESDAETAMITAKAYSGESNVTAKVTVTYGVEGTTVSKVISVIVKGTNGDDPSQSLPDKKIEFTAHLNDYYGGTGNAIYHDYFSLAEITDKFEYSLANIQVSATLDGKEIAVELLPNGSLGGDKNMHFHAKIGGSDTTLDEIKSGLIITMIFIGTDGQPCAYALIEN